MTLTQNYKIWLPAGLQMYYVDTWKYDVALTVFWCKQKWWLFKRGPLERAALLGLKSILAQALLLRFSAAVWAEASSAQQRRSKLLLLTLQNLSAQCVCASHTHTHRFSFVATRLESNFIIWETFKKQQLFSFINWPFYETIGESRTLF